MRRGFTLIEFSVSLSILALVVPLAFLLGRSLQDSQLEAAAQAEAASSMRSVSEELRRDLKTMGWPDETSLRLAGAGRCPEVEYLVTEENVLERHGGDSCGPPRAIAARVGEVRRERGGLRVVFFKRISASRVRTDSFFLGFGE